VPFRVERITPMAVTAEGRNIFEVEALLSPHSVALHPGLRGVAKLSAGRHSTAWRWTGFSSTRRSVFQSDLEVEIVFLGRPGRIRAPDLLALQQEVPGHAVVRADLLLRLG